MKKLYYPVFDAIEDIIKETSDTIVVKGDIEYKKSNIHRLKSKGMVKIYEKCRK